MTKIIETPILETARLILKPLSLEYADTLEKHFNNWNVIKSLNDQIPWPYPKGGMAHHLIHEALPRMQKSKALLWLLFLKETPEAPIGRLDYRLERMPNDQEDRGFWLAEPCWGKGLMSEAVVCGNDYIFDILGHKKISMQNYTDNIGSHRVKEKTGAKLLKTTTEKWRGEDREVEIWELTAEDWRKFRKQY
jgi:RimJ/RimL family protein N-acetyltransferase